MRRAAWTRLPIWLLWFLIVLGILFSGCSHASRYQKNTGSDNSSQENNSASKQPAASYYDFGDVLIPGELRINRQESFVYESSGFVTGVLALNGKIALHPLITFFTSNMVKDNWERISSIKSAHTLMLFKKENRWCVITIVEKGLFSTEVKIWVVPDALKI